MSNTIEVLLSAMNIKNKNDFNELLKKNKITSNVLVINQTDDKNINLEINENGKRLYTYNEKGTSKSRNKQLVKSIGDICILADDDMVYVNNYEEIVKQEYIKNPQADMIIFNIENMNKERKKFKKLRKKKVNFLDIMKIRTSQITFKRSILDKYKIHFDEDFGPNSKFSKGEETIFLRDALKSKIKIFSINKKLGTVLNDRSTWFTGFNKKYLYDQGAIFYRAYPKIYIFIILQYVIRKYKLYKKNIKIIEALKQMCKGAKDCKRYYINNKI